MTGQLIDGHALGAGCDHRFGFLRGAGADGVAERDLIAPHVVERGRHFRHPRGRDLALVRAAEHAGHIAAHLDAVLARRLRDRPEALERLGDRAVDVPARKGLGGGLEALEVGREHRVIDAGLAADALEHLGVIGHLRHPFRRDERGGLHRGQTGVGQPLDQLDLHGGGHLARLVLQPVARADLHDAHRLAHSSRINSAPSSTCSPAT